MLSFIISSGLSRCRSDQLFIHQLNIVLDPGEDRGGRPVIDVSGALNTQLMRRKKSHARLKPVLKKGPSPPRVSRKDARLRDHFRGHLFVARAEVLLWVLVIYRRCSSFCPEKAQSRKASSSPQRRSSPNPQISISRISHFVMPTGMSSTGRQCHPSYRVSPPAFVNTHEALQKRVPTNNAPRPHAFGGFVGCFLGPNCKKARVDYRHHTTDAETAIDHNIDPEKS